MIEVDLNGKKYKFETYEEFVNFVNKPNTFKEDNESNLNAILKNIDNFSLDNLCKEIKKIKDTFLDNYKTVKYSKDEINKLFQEKIDKYKKEHSNVYDKLKQIEASLKENVAEYNKLFCEQSTLSTKLKKYEYVLDLLNDVKNLSIIPEEIKNASQNKKETENYNCSCNNCKGKEKYYYDYYTLEDLEKDFEDLKLFLFK